MIIIKLFPVPSGNPVVNQSGLFVTILPRATVEPGNHKLIIILNVNFLSNYPLIR